MVAMPAPTKIIVADKSKILTVISLPVKNLSIRRGNSKIPGCWKTEIASSPALLAMTQGLILLPLRGLQGRPWQSLMPSSDFFNSPNSGCFARNHSRPAGTGFSIIIGTRRLYLVVFYLIRFDLAHHLNVFSTTPNVYKNQRIKKLQILSDFCCFWH